MDAAYLIILEVTAGSSLPCIMYKLKGLYR